MDEDENYDSFESISLITCEGIETIQVVGYENEDLVDFSTAVFYGNMSEVQYTVVTEADVYYLVISIGETQVAKYPMIYEKYSVE